MTVEVRSLFYYILQGSAVDASASQFAQHLNHYVVSGSNSANPVGTARAYVSEYGPIVVSGGTNGRPAAYAIEHSWFLIQGGAQGGGGTRTTAERSGLWAINGRSRPNDVVADRTCLYVINDE